MSRTQFLTACSALGFKAHSTGLRGTALSAIARSSLGPFACRMLAKFSGVPLEGTGPDESRRSSQEHLSSQEIPISSASTTRERRQDELSPISLDFLDPESAEPCMNESRNLSQSVIGASSG